MQALLDALAELEQEVHRCDRRLRQLKDLRAWREAHGLRQARKTEGWTDEKRSAVSERMRAYWAQRRKDEAAQAPANDDGQKKTGRAGASVEDAEAPRARASKAWSDASRAAASQRMAERWRSRRGRAGGGPPPSVRP